jgi:hypothetical protein
MKSLAKQHKKIAIFMTLVMVGEILAPLPALALTGGPSQPEVQSFAPVGSSDMVDLFTGDFNYNIPLMDVDGYPLNLVYNGGVTMDQEASWVGLGWNLNPGVINRNLRGLPDDFNGDQITSRLNMKDNITSTVGVSLTPEIFGLNSEGSPIKMSINAGMCLNNYRGLGFNFGIDPSIGMGGNNIGLGAGLGLNFSTMDGFSADILLNADANKDNEEKKTSSGYGLNASIGYNSRSGLKTLSFGLNYSQQKEKPGKKSSDSYSHEGYNQTFGTPTYTPNMTTNSNSFSYNTDMGTGVEIYGINAKLKATMNISVTNYLSEPVSKPAYGYMFGENKVDDDVLLDFNREKDGPFIATSPLLPMPIATYDLFSVSAQGIGGTFRAYRNDFPMYHDDRKWENSTRRNKRKRLVSTSVGAEFGATETLKLGVNPTLVFNQASTGRWDNNFADKLDFLRSVDGNPYYEPSYFKMLGEMSPQQALTTADIGNDRLIALKTNIGVLDNVIKIYSSYVKKVVPGLTRVTHPFYYAAREKRTKLISYLSATEASVVGPDKDINFIPNPTNPFSFGSVVSVPRSSNDRMGHHISEVTVTGEDGQRFVYGIPAYNHITYERSFAINVSGLDTINGGVEYSSLDDGTGNTQGADNYFSSKRVPGYSHSHLLTAVLSPDYVDVTNNGITDDDLGSATKFTYRLATPRFKWRAPLKNKFANHQEGNKSSTLDDKASYIYGEKEIWHLAAVEGKNHIAVFELSQRCDALGVLSHEGGKNNSMRSYLLKKITLYAKDDYSIMGSSAYPIKTIHFNYDYSLCGNVENNSGETLDGGINDNSGKLTLKSVYFTYGKSNKGRLSPYVFNYSDLNPDYSSKSADRWGNYKPKKGSIGLEGGPNNMEYPYTSQNPDSADWYAQAWCLTEVVLPSGGKIQVTYESDDYAYVQNKKAMHMFQIQGFNFNGGDTTGTNREVFLATEKKSPKPYVYFKLDAPITGADKNVKFRKQYLGDLKTIQFDILALVSSDRDKSYEFVKVYADIEPDKCGVSNDGYSGYLYVTPKPIKSRKSDSTEKKVNPIAKGIWQFIRTQVPYQIYPLSDKNRKYDNGKDRKTISTMRTAFSKFSRIFSGGIENYLFKQGYGSLIIPRKSWVRLNDPDSRKMGGGHRVKKITLNDDWASMTQDTGRENQSYGQEYIYETTGEFSEVISSGVAAWEPAIGCDENPFRKPIETVEDLKWAPDMIHSTDEPFGESFSPSPLVGYSQVKVVALIPEGVTRQGTGYTLNMFYTAKDYPFQADYSQINVDIIEPKFNFFPYKKKTFHTTASQGFLIQTNDMHGKPKGELIYSKDGYVVSGTTNIYAFEKDDPTKLDNTVLSMADNGTISEQEFGVTTDFYSDVRESNSETVTGKLPFNMDLFKIGIYPIPIISLFSFPKRESRIFQSAVVVKHINRVGILKQTLAYQEGTSIITENLLYDNETGQVILASVQNEFHDKLFNFTYPAHMAYDKGMGAGYKNTGLMLSNIVFDGSVPKIDGNDLNTYLVPGDECMLYKGSSLTPTIVFAFRGTDDIINFIDENGEVINGPGVYHLKVYRSGRRNMQSLPIGMVTTLKNPINIGSHIVEFDSVLNSSATEYSDNWKVYCNQINSKIIVCDSTSDDFIKGLNASLHSTWTGPRIDDINGVGPGTSSITTVDTGDFYPESQYFKTWFRKTCKYNNSENPSTYNTLLNSNQIFFNVDSLDGNMTVELYRLQDTANGQRRNSYGRSFTISYAFVNDLCYCTGGLFKFKLFADQAISFSDIDSFRRPKPLLNTLLEGSPGKAYQFEMIAVINDSTEVRFTGYNSCQKIYTLCRTVCTPIEFAQIINPYKAGIKGNWRKVSDYAFSGERRYASSKSAPQRDATYSSSQYTDFWKKDGYASEATGSFYSADKSNTKWVWTNEVTLYSPNGPEIENRNALDIFSSALYGFRQTLPMAVASNAKFRQIGYESFEDQTSLLDCEEGHFSFIKDLGEDAVLDYTKKHSGKTSIKVKPDHIYTNSIIIDNGTEEFNKEEDNYYNKSKTDCIGTFQPDSGYYLVGAWLKDSVSALDTIFGEPELTVEVVHPGGTTTYHLKSSGLIIGGWQRLEGKIKIFSGTTAINFKLKAAESHCSWFDDIRVHPLLANIKSYAYDPITLRLMADLDENNYTTFYEYDLEGNLTRIKRETERGILTIKESKSSIKGAK